jgi:drug/metabolite transporter (DMT)-like permease
MNSTASAKSMPRLVPTYVAAAVTVMLWASAFPGIRAGLVGYRPTQLAVLRYLVASILLLLVAPLAHVRVPLIRDIPTLAVLGGVGITAYNLALNYGETRVPAGAASFLGNTVPIFTAVLASFFLHERLRSLGWMGLLVSFTGSAVIAFGSGGGYGFNPWTALVLAAAIFQAIFFVLQKPLLRSYRPMELTAYAIWSGTIFNLAFLPGLKDAVIRSPQSATLAAVYLGVFPASIAYLAWAFVLSRRSAQEAGSFLYLVPVVSVIIAWVWLGEKPSALTLIGGALTLGGVVLVTASGRGRTPSFTGNDLIPCEERRRGK